MKSEQGGGQREKEKCSYTTRKPVQVFILVYLFQYLVFLHTLYSIDLILSDRPLQVGGVGQSGHSHHHGSSVISDIIQYIYSNIYTINADIYIIN